VEPVTLKNIQDDARLFEECFCRDARFLHAHTGDHDCSSTCVKKPKKKLGASSKNAEEHECFTVPFLFLQSRRAAHVRRIGEDKLRKARRRGRDLVDKPYITATNDRNEFGLTQVERPQPFLGFK
jgi:hypothetical protein